MMSDHLKITFFLLIALFHFIESNNTFLYKKIKRKPFNNHHRYSLNQQRQQNDPDEMNNQFDLFICTQTQLKFAINEKSHFEEFDLIITQNTVNDLLKQQMISFESFKEYTFPSDWNDQDSIDLFLENLRTYSNAIVERHQVLTCEIMSNLLIIRALNLSSIESIFGSKNLSDAHLSDLNANNCSNELDSLAKLADSLEFASSQISNNKSRSVNESLDERLHLFLDCLESVYKQLNAFAKKHSNLTNSRDLELKLVILIRKLQTDLNYKMNDLLKYSQLAADKLSTASVLPK